MLLFLLRADAGDVRVLGGDPWRDAVALHRRLAYVPGDVNLWPNLSGGEAIDLFGALLVAAGAGMGVGDAAVGGDAGVGTLTAAGLAQLPAALTVAGFVLLVFGGLPRLVVSLAWAALVVSLVCGLLGDLFGLPRAVRDLSPFSHVRAMPAAGPLVVLVTVAAALAAAGLALFRRRDLAA